MRPCVSVWPLLILWGFQQWIRQAEWSAAYSPEISGGIWPFPLPLPLISPFWVPREVSISHLNSQFPCQLEWTCTAPKIHVVLHLPLSPPLPPPCPLLRLTMKSLSHPLHISFYLIPLPLWDFRLLQWLRLSIHPLQVFPLNGSTTNLRFVGSCYGVSPFDLRYTNSFVASLCCDRTRLHLVHDRERSTKKRFPQPLQVIGSSNGSWGC